MSSSSALPPHATGPRGLERLPSLAAQSPLRIRSEPFYFLRHGQTPRNAQRIFQSYDEPLSTLGEQQAERAAQALRSEPIRTIVASDARRALQTAHTVAQALGLSIIERAGLRERHFGDLVGSSSADIDWDCRPAGGETLDDFVARQSAALTEALQAPAPVLVVAHGGTLYVLAALLGVPLEVALLANAHPLRFSPGQQGWQAQPLLDNPVDSPSSVALS